MLKNIKFLGDELGLSYDLEGSYGRKLLHQSIDKFYNTFLTTDMDEDDNITRYYLDTDITGSQIELRDRLAKNEVRDFIFECNDIDIVEYETELHQLHDLISNQDIDSLIDFDSKFYFNLFTLDI
ncbi:MAG: hypothetical protein M0Q88_05845 [Bacilli bacterium]|nr:hypothetical protein [Bacilli bacterium]